MTAAFEAADLARFRTAIAHRLGLNFDDAKLALLAEVLERRISSCGVAIVPYLERVENQRGVLEELRELARELTIGETYLFRHVEQFRAFAEVALPERLATRTSRSLKLLSAGCASGEEAYTLAILVRERGNLAGTEVVIQAADINPAMLAKADGARYAAWSLRETPADIQQRWFLPHGREFDLHPSIRAAVTFEERNLANDDPILWQAGIYDIVFCRNVMMYFTPENAARLVARLTRSLVPGGYLFLGHAETLRGISHDFHLRHTHGTFYYQRKDGPKPSSNDEPRSKVAWEIPSSLSSDPGWSTTWIETIQRASDRIKTLAEQGFTPAPVPTKVELEVKTDLGLALELLRRERFTEALDLLGTLSRTAAREPELMLLRAVLLAHSGELRRAEKVCSELLLLDEFSAGAHYVLALCAEGLGDRKGAADHDQTAVYLDPTFAIPRLHLGLMARRAGDVQTAERELQLALALLEREEASRLLLFGGGFSRDNLMELCRAELGRLGGPA